MMEFTQAQNRRLISIDSGNIVAVVEREPARTGIRCCGHPEPFVVEGAYKDVLESVIKAKQELSE